MIYDLGSKKPIVWLLEGVKMCRVATLQLGTVNASPKSPKFGMGDAHNALPVYYLFYTES